MLIRSGLSSGWEDYLTLSHCGRDTARPSVFGYAGQRVELRLAHVFMQNKKGHRLRVHEYKSEGFGFMSDSQVFFGGSSNQSLSIFNLIFN